jgi:hypothetical protein
MQIKVYAFELQQGDGFTLPEFLEELGKESSKLIDQDYYLPLIKIDANYVGLLLRPKESKKFCKIKTGQGKFTVTAEQLEAGTNLADFNFFIINPSTGRGLYQYYHRSTATSEFLQILKHRWNSQRVPRFTKAIENTNTEEARKAVKKSFRRNLKGRLVYRADSFAKKLGTISRFTSLDFSIGTTIRNEGRFLLSSDFSPAKDELRGLSAQIRFAQTANMNQVRTLISGLANAHKLDRARVDGEDENGIEVYYKLYNDADIFEEYNFDEMVNLLEISSDDLSGTVKKANLVAKLLELCQQPHISAMLGTHPQAW